MILAYINKKDSWKSKDLIAYFGLYLDPDKDREKLSSFKDEYGEALFSLDKETNETLFYATEILMSG